MFMLCWHNYSHADDSEKTNKKARNNPLESGNNDKLRQIKTQPTRNKAGNRSVTSLELGFVAKTGCLTVGFATPVIGPAASSLVATGKAGLAVAAVELLRTCVGAVTPAGLLVATGELDTVREAAMIAAAAAACDDAGAGAVVARTAFGALGVAACLATAGAALFAGTAPLCTTCPTFDIRP